MAEKPSSGKDEMEAEGAAAPAKKKPLLLIAIAGVVVLLLAGGVGAYFWMSSRGESDSSEEKSLTELEGGESHDPEKKDEGGEGSEHGSAGGDDAVFRFEKPFYVSLSDPGTPKSIQLFLTLELNDAGHVEKVKSQEDKFRDIIITEIQGHTRTELVTAEGKERLKRDIMRRIGEALGDAKAVKGVYFPDYLV